MVIVGFVASVVTILGGMVMIARYFLRRAAQWIDAVVDNSKAIRTLTVRVTALESTLEKGNLCVGL